MSDLALPNNNLAGGVLVAGSPFSARLALTVASTGAAATDYTGSEAVSGVFVPGPGLPAEWAASVAWESPFDEDEPAVLLSWAEDVTADVDDGTYYCQLTVDGAKVYVGLVSILAGAGADTIAPTPLISTTEFKTRAGSWPESLQTGTTTAGLKRTLSKATADLHNAIADRYSQSFRGGIGADETTRRAALMTVLATPANLAVTEPMRDFVACQALWYLTRFKPPGKDDKTGLAAVARRAEQDAGQALRRVVAKVEGYGQPIVLGGQVRLSRG
jgi:hypothetical protein